MPDYAIKEFTVPVPEGGSVLYTAAIVKENGDVLQPEEVVSASITLEDAATQAIINDRDNQSFFNVNGGAFYADRFEVRLGPLDTVAVGTARIQKRWMTLKVAYTGGGMLHRLIVFYVQELRRVGA